MRRLLFVVGVSATLAVVGTAVATTINGTKGNDTIRGTARADVLNGMGGGDTISGLAGNDRINGGPGDDRINGGLGDDRISGGDGKDIVFCGAGVDRLQADRLDVVAKDCEVVTRAAVSTPPTSTPPPTPPAPPTPPTPPPPAPIDNAPVQVAVVLDTSEPIASLLTEGIRNAIRMAVSEHPTIRGFPIQLNDNFSGPCGEGAIDANTATAQSVVSNPQNVAVIGHMCSNSFASQCQATPTALSTYENAGIVAINGSTTFPCLPSVGPRVFDGVAVPGDDFDKWYGGVQALQSNIGWRAAYAAKFGKSATQFADLYYDATNLLLARLTEVSKIENGKLVIDRVELAKAVRNTAGFCGVTGKLSLDTGGYRINAIAPC